VGFGEWAAIDELDGDVLLLELDIRLTSLGRLFTSLLKSPTLSVEVETDEGSVFARRIVAGMMRTGVLARPIVSGTEGWMRYEAGLGGPALTRFRVLCGFGQRLFEPEIGVRVVRADGLAPEPMEDAGALLYAMFPTAPSSVTSVEPPRRMVMRNVELLRVDAPSEMVFPVDAGRHVVRAGFGILPEGYLKLGSDGAEFAIVVADEDGTEREVWSRMLEPALVPEHCRLQELEVAIEAPERARVLLRVGPGPAGRREGDLSFWTAVEIAPVAAEVGR
jgi:hypothetical protein